MDGNVAVGDLVDFVENAACLGGFPVDVLAVVEELVVAVADADPAARGLHGGRDGGAVGRRLQGGEVSEQVWRLVGDLVDVHADTVEFLRDLVDHVFDRVCVEDVVADVLNPKIAWLLDERRELADDARDRPLVSRVLPLLDAQDVREGVGQEFLCGFVLADFLDATLVRQYNLGKIDKGKDHALRVCAGHCARPDAEPLLSVENIVHAGPELPEPVNLGDERIDLHEDDQIADLNSARIDSLASRWLLLFGMDKLANATYLKATHLGGLANHGPVIHRDSGAVSLDFLLCHNFTHAHELALVRFAWL